MRKLFYAVFLLCVILLSSCLQEGKQASDTKQGELKNVLEFPDATEFISGWSKENKLVVHLMSDPAYLHPAAFKTTPAVMILQLTQGKLLQTDLAHPQVVPGIVKSLPAVSSDGLQYTFNLLDEARWDDGTPVTAEDVIFTLKVHKCRTVISPNISSYTQNVKSVLVDAANPKIFTLIMKRAYVSNQTFLADIPVLCRAFFDQENMLSHYTIEQLDDSSLHYEHDPKLAAWSNNFNDGKYGNDPAYFYGCGPYKIVQWDRGQSVILQRKENHWTQQLHAANPFLNSYPDQIIFKIMKDENALELEFKAQTFDATNYLPTKVLVDLQKDSSFNLNYHSAFLESYSGTSIVFNMKPDGIHHHKIFDDRSVRRAFALLTPVDQIISVVVLGKATRWPSIISPIRPDFNHDLALLPYDVNEANRLLDEAGWKDSDRDGVRDKIIDGTKTSLDVTLLIQEQGNLTRDISNMIAESAAQAGFKVTPQFLEQGTLSEQLQSHDFDLGLVSMSYSALQEDYSQLWHSETSQTHGGSNYSGFGNAASDALIDSIKFTLNDSLRHSMSKRLQKIIYDQQPCVFMYSTNRKIIIHRRWGNQRMYSEFPGFILNNLRLISAPANTAALLTDN